MKIINSIIFLVLLVVMLAAFAVATVFLDDTDTDWDGGTLHNMVVIGTGADANISSSGNNVFGHFASQIFDATATANWTNITIRTEVPYQTEIGRAVGDGNSATDEDGFINTSGLVLLFHFNNNSAFGEATETSGGNTEKILDFSVDVNSERSGSARNNGLFDNGATINKTSYFLGGGAAEFDGAGDVIDVAHHTSLRLSDMTLEAWVKWIAGSGGFDTIVWRDALVGQQNYGFFIDDEAASPRLGLAMRDTGTFPHSLFAPNGAAPQPGVWTHVAATYDGSTQKIFMDGLEVASKNDAFSPHQALSVGITIGEGGGVGQRLFHGNIDEVAVWNRTLSATEILQHYKRGALRLNLSVRSCDDSACSGDTYNQVFNKSFMGGIVPLNGTPTNQFFQYNLTYSRDVTSVGGNHTIINNVSVEYFAAVTDTCTYSSGNWVVDAADNCVISSDTDLGDNDLIITGTGTFDITAKISNFGKIIVHGANAKLTCRNTNGCFG